MKNRMMKHSRIFQLLKNLALIVSLASVVSPLAAQTSVADSQPQQGAAAILRPAQASKIEVAVKQLMREKNLVGVAVGYIQDGKVVYTSGFGKANLATGEDVTQYSIFNWASNSKPVMGILALQLVQNKMLDLDAPIRVYLPQLPEHLHTITTRQLLCHQSGIPHYTNGKIISTRQKVTPQDELDPLIAINRFILSPLIFAPGTKTDYSSHAYVLLSAVVQAAGRQPIDQQLDERIVRPLNLTSFQLDLPRDNQTNWVKAYQSLFQSPIELPDTAHFWKHGAGGYKSNIQDFASFARALMNRELIDQATTSLMWTNQTTLDGKSSNYGLGVLVEGKDNTLKVSHNGSQEETKTRMVIYPNRGEGVVVMCNSQPCEPSLISTAVFESLKKPQN